MAIDVLDTGHDALPKLVLRGHADVAQYRSGELGEEALDEVEPGAVRGCERELEAAGGSSGKPSSGFSGDVRGMIVEDQLDRGAGRIGRIKQLEELDELQAAVAVSDQGMHLAGEQINPGQQAERAMAFVFMIAREGRMDAGLGRQIRRGRRNGLDSRLFIVGDDRYRLAGFPRFGGSFFQDVDLAIDTQNLRHLLLELGVAVFQVVAHFLRLDVLLAEDLAPPALAQIGETVVPRHRSVLARMACQQPCRPQLMRIAVLPRLVARQRYQPSLGFRPDRWLLARSWSVIKCRQRAVGQRPLDASLHRLVMLAKVLPYREERWFLTVSEHHLRPLHSACRLASGARDDRQPPNLLIGHRQLDHLTPSCHDAIPRSVKPKRGNPQTNHR